MDTGKGRILIIDDEETILTMMKRMLESLCYTVMAEISSVKALKMLISDPGRFDLVITDQSMPNMSGLELVAEILKIRPTMPIVLCTGYSDEVSAENAGQKGISRYISKPFRLKELTEVVSEVLAELG